MLLNNASKPLKLSREARRNLRSLFEALQATGRQPRWVHEPSRAQPLAELQHQGLLSERMQLTLHGLVVAVNLPALGLRRILRAA